MDGRGGVSKGENRVKKGRRGERRERERETDASGCGSIGEESDSENGGEVAGYEKQN